MPWCLPPRDASGAGMLPLLIDSTCRARARCQCRRATGQGPRRSVRRRARPRGAWRRRSAPPPAGLPLQGSRSVFHREEGAGTLSAVRWRCNDRRPGRFRKAADDGQRSRPFGGRRAPRMTMTPAESVEQPPRPRRRGLLALLGPGLITGASDDDPSGIATYSQAGAAFGYGLAWTLLFSYPLMAGIQEISARIGRVTGRGIAGNLRRYYPRWLLHLFVALILVANIINLGADLGAMGAAVNLLVGGPALVYVALIGAASVLLEIFVRYSRYVAALKWLSLTLLAYVATMFAVRMP